MNNIMENCKDYRCPRDCPGRSKDCHASCERYEKFCELNAKRLKAEHDESITITEAHRKKLMKTVRIRHPKGGWD